MHSAAYVQKWIRTHPLRALPAFIVLIGAASVGSQRDSPHPENREATEFREELRQQQTAMLPPTIGQDITLSPRDLPDISCSVVEWKNDEATPTLSVICPPEGTFSPLHVYLKLSWLKPEDVPLSAHWITAPEGILTKIRTNKATAWVWLGVREKQDGQSHMTWVAFNGLADMALLNLARKR